MGRAFLFILSSPLARLLFHANDEPLLKHQFDDNLKIEPEWYCPIIPTTLCNGAEGIGTGWSTKIPNYDVREVVANVKRMIDGLEPKKMIPSYKNFRGLIEEIGEGRFLVSGEVSIIDDQTIEISELPIRSWTQSYKEDVLEPMLYGSDKTPALITDYKEYHTDTTVKFTIKMTSDKLARAEETGLHKVFKLQNQISTSSMVMFDSQGCIKRYTTAEDILKEFFELRLVMYKRRKDYLEGMLGAESLRLDNIARFIIEKIEGTIVVENKRKVEIIQILVRRGFDSDPVKSWKDLQNKGKNEVREEDDDADDDADSVSSTTSGPDFNYLLGMPLWNLTREKKDQLCKQRDAKAHELSILRRKSPTDLWEEDLEAFLENLNVVEEQENLDHKASLNIKSKSVKLGGKLKQRNVMAAEIMPSPSGRRVVPRVDSAMKLKATKDAVKKSKTLAKKTLKIDDDDIDIDIKEENGEEGETPPSRPAATDQPKKVCKIKTSPSPGPGLSPLKKKKGGKKKNPWSDSESNQSDMCSDMEEDGDGSFVVAPRDRGPRRTAASKIKYDVSDEEQIKSENSDTDDEISPVVNGNNGRARPRSPPTFPDSDDDDDDDKDSNSLPKSSIFGKSRMPAKTKAPAITADFSESEDDKESSVPPTLKWGSTASDSERITLDSDDEIFPSKTKPAAKKAKVAPKPRVKKVDTKQPTVDSIFSKARVKPAKSKALTISDSEDDQGSVDFATFKKDKPAAEKKPEKKSKKAKKGSDDESKLKKKKAPAKRPKFVDSDDSDTFLPAKKTKATKKMVESSDDDDDDEEDLDMDMDKDDSYVPSPRGTTTGRVRASVKYTYDDNEESDF